MDASYLMGWYSTFGYSPEAQKWNRLTISDDSSLRTYITNPIISTNISGPTVNSQSQVVVGGLIQVDAQGGSEGWPVLIGGKAYADIENNSPVDSDDDMQTFSLTRKGALWIEHKALDSLSGVIVPQGSETSRVHVVGSIASNGINAMPLQSDTNGYLKVLLQGTSAVSLTVVPEHPVTNSGTFAVQVGGAALTSLQLLDDTIIADDAAFTIGTTKVNMAGGYAVAHGANPDAADAGDAGAILMNRHRIPFTMGGHPNTVSAEYYSTGNITDDNILPAISAGTKYVITSITVSASAANTTNATVRIGFGATTVPAQGATNADAVAKVVMSLPGIPAGGGAVKGNGGGIVGVGGDGEELRVTITNMATGALTIVVDYYTIES